MAGFWIQQVLSRSVSVLLVEFVQRRRRRSRGGREQKEGGEERREEEEKEKLLISLSGGYQVDGLPPDFQ